MPRLYTVKEVADMLRCDRQTVYGLVQAESIPHLRVGRLIRFDPETLERWIKDEIRGPKAR